MDNESLKNAQETVDKELSKYRNKVSKKTNDTVMALAHLTENIEWYKYKSLDEYSADRANYIVRKLWIHFPNMNDRVIKRRLLRYGILSLFHFIVFIVTCILLLSTGLTYLIDYEDKLMLIPHWVAAILFGTMFTLVSALIYEEHHWIRFFRVKKDL